jgi:hypothetical protein
MPFLRRQRRPPSTPRAGLQSWQFHANASDAQGGGAGGSLTSLREKPIKIGAKIVGHGRYVAFQMAAVAV